MQMSSWGAFTDGLEEKIADDSSAGLFSIQERDSLFVLNGDFSTLSSPHECENDSIMLASCFSQFFDNYEGPYRSLFMDYVNTVEIDCECESELYCGLLFEVSYGDILFDSPEELLYFLSYERYCVGCDEAY